MLIYALESFYGGSHKKWIDSYQGCSQYKIKIFSLKARHWKWRMESGAITFAKMLNAESDIPEGILCTDMTNVALLKSLLKEELKSVPMLLYMHENQLVYPWSETDQDVALGRDVHYSFINYTSCLVADSVLFNSQYHQRSFLEALQALLKKFPDHQHKEHVDTIREKSNVVPVGIDLDLIEANKTEKVKDENIILWNHRWEYDKRPALFFEALYQLQKDHIDFKLIVLGEKNVQYPSIFDQAKKDFSKQSIHWGYCEDLSAYYHFLWLANIAPVTAKQDFFGISVVEAMATQNHMILPFNLSYPEHLSEDQVETHCYRDDALFYPMLKAYCLESPLHGVNYPKILSYHWKQVGKLLDYEWEILALSTKSI